METSSTAVGKTKRGRGTKWMVLVDGKGIPLGFRQEGAFPSEVSLAEATVAQVRVPPNQRLSAETAKAHHSRPQL